MRGGGGGGAGSGRYRGGRRAAGRPVALGAALCALLCLALTACTDGDRVPAATSGPLSATPTRGSTAPRPSTARERPGPFATAPAPGPSGQSPTPDTAPATPATSLTSAPSPGATGTAAPDAPLDDGGDDARVFCSPSALSFVLRLAGAPSGAPSPRPGAAGVREPALDDAVLVARNTSGHTCVLRGTPTLTVTDDSGRLTVPAIPAKPFAKPFALHPGAGGAARVRYTARPGCRGTAVRVAVPGSATANSVPVLDPLGHPAPLSVCPPALRVEAFRPGFG
ncbi:DUF4232 domain-containing protein [Streptomyces sp. NPDC006704]|uniref:DUF4232 domain-containing protein n=1 Tax=Streptomyces sp. NPDC006704 TaxID=3364760 RepID=UPI00367F8309